MSDPTIHHDDTERQAIADVIRLRFAESPDLERDKRRTRLFLRTMADRHLHAMESALKAADQYGTATVLVWLAELRSEQKASR